MPSPARGRRLVLACALAALAALGAAAPKPGIEVLESRLIDDVTARVAYRFTGALDAEAAQRLDAGETLTFRHRVEVLGPRRWWRPWRRVLAASLVESEARRDALTERYRLTRSVRRRVKPRKDAPEPIQTEATTDSFDEVIDWMTRFDLEVVSARALPTHRNLVARVEASFGRRFVAWIFPRPIAARARQPLEPAT